MSFRNVTIIGVNYYHLYYYFNLNDIKEKYQIFLLADQILLLKILYLMFGFSNFPTFESHKML